MSKIESLGWFYCAAHPCAKISVVDSTAKICGAHFNKDFKEGKVEPFLTTSI